MSNWGLMDEIYAAGGRAKEKNYVLRWQDGKQLSARPGKDWVTYRSRHFRAKIYAKTYHGVGDFELRPPMAVSYCQRQSNCRIIGKTDYHV